MSLIADAGQEPDFPIDLVSARKPEEVAAVSLKMCDDEVFGSIRVLALEALSLLVVANDFESRSESQW